jgi:hypothetical protein
VPAGGAATAVTDRPHAYACVGSRPVRFTMVVQELHSRNTKRVGPKDTKGSNTKDATAINRKSTKGRGGRT